MTQDYKIQPANSPSRRNSSLRKIYSHFLSHMSVDLYDGQYGSISHLQTQFKLFIPGLQNSDQHLLTNH